MTPAHDRQERNKIHHNKMLLWWEGYQHVSDIVEASTAALSPHAVDKHDLLKNPEFCRHQRIITHHKLQFKVVVSSLEKISLHSMAPK
jgi:hypothetical protein